MVSRNCNNDKEEASISFITKLKKTLNPKDYNNFLNTMCAFKARGICTADMLMSVNQALCYDKQLVSQFNRFLPKEYKITAANAANSTKQLTWFSVKKASVDFFNKVRTTYNDDNDAKYRAFLSIMSNHLNGNDNYQMINIKKVHDEVFDLFRDNPHLFLEFTRLFIHQNPENLRINSTSNYSEKTEKKEEKIRCSNKNQWFQHEDRLFEMDMVIGHLESTIKQSELFLGDYYGEDNRNAGELEGYFRAHEIKCIKNVYGAKQGEYMVKILRINPVDVLENALPLLRKKLDESSDSHKAFKKKLTRMNESERKKVDIAGSNQLASSDSSS